MDEREQPRPGPLTPSTPDTDPEWAEYVAWVDRELAVGPDGSPGPRVAAKPWAPAESWVAGEDEPEDPTEAWNRWRPGFGQGEEADVLPPGPLLAGLTEQAVADLGRLSDNELVGVLQAACRQIAREQYKQVLATAEFARRREAAPAPPPATPPAARPRP